MRGAIEAGGFLDVRFDDDHLQTFVLDPPLHFDQFDLEASKLLLVDLVLNLVLFCLHVAIGGRNAEFEAILIFFFSMVLAVMVLAFTNLSTALTSIRARQPGTKDYDSTSCRPNFAISFNE